MDLNGDRMIFPDDLNKKQNKTKQNKTKTKKTLLKILVSQESLGFFS